MKSKKLMNIAFIKTTMMLVIIIYHCMLYFGGSWFEYVAPAFNAKYLYYIALWMNSFHIQTFTMASGFLFYYLKIEYNKYKNPLIDIKKRAKRLLIPCIFAISFWVLPIVSCFSYYSTKDIIKNYILMVNPNQLWFLIMLFNVFVFFDLMSNRIKINFKTFVIIYIITTIIGLGLSFFDINYFQISKSVSFILYFYLGGYIYLNKDKITLKQTILMIVMATVLYGLNVFIDNCLNMKILRYGMKLVKPLISILEVSTIYYLCTKFLNIKHKFVDNRVYRILEENSFGIYLFHQQIIYFIIVLINGLIHPIIQVIISFVIAIIISLMMSIILKKNKVTKFMFGL